MKTLSAIITAALLSSCVPPRAIPVPEARTAEKSSEVWDYPAWN